MDKRTCVIAFAALTLIASGASAEVVDGVNWADAITEYTANIQNYGGAFLDDDVTWWLTGPPDADANNNGYAWDTGDPDNVAGWRSTNPDESITLFWETGLPDTQGEDLHIYYYGGAAAAAHAYASTDGETFEYIGGVYGGTPGFISVASLDFNGLFESDVHYVMLVRSTSGPQTGLFFDAIGGNAPEIRGDLDGDGEIDLNDVPHFIDALLSNPPSQAGIDQNEADVNGDERIDGNDIQPFLHAVIESA